MQFTAIDEADWRRKHDGSPPNEGCLIAPLLSSCNCHQSSLMNHLTRFLPLLLMGALTSAAIAAPFQRALNLQGVTFQVKADGEGSVQRLVVKASHAGHSFPALTEDVVGTVTAAEVEDLNSDGRPELLLFVTSAGSGNYGSVIAWSTSQRHTLLPISLPELTGKMAQEYRGHDQFAVVETTLMRRFPIYHRGDTNANPTGGTRQISYRLVAGEAGFQFRPVSNTTSW
jgi:hypothetical protein